MIGLEENFRKWLSENRKDSTIDTYIRRIITLCKKNFVQENFHFNNNYLGFLAENLMPLLIKSYELSNKEYYIDRVTIWHALDYFSRIFEAINTSRHLNNNQTVKLYFYCYEGDFQIDSVSFENLRDYVQLFNSFCYKRDRQSIHPFSEEIQNFLSKIEKIIAENHIKISSVYDAALHIIYPYQSAKLEKTALVHYCNFLYTQTRSTQYDYRSNTFINLVRTQNPAKEPKNYDIVHEVTGNRPMEIAVKTDLALRYDDPEYTLTIRNLAEIFNISETSGINLLEKYKKSYPHKTVLQSYYSISATNECLKQYYYKILKPHSDVNYEKKGYINWCNRKTALAILNIRQKAFYSHIGETSELMKNWRSCSHIEYSPQAPQYYIPDLEYLAELPEIKRISRYKNRKNK